jgi:hypothetical protein
VASATHLPPLSPEFHAHGVAEWQLVPGRACVLHWMVAGKFSPEGIGTRLMEFAATARVGDREPDLFHLQADPGYAAGDVEHRQPVEPGCGGHP